MSEMINNSKIRVQKLKELLLDLHKGITIEITQQKLSKLMENVPYGEVVQAEQELIEEGLPPEEIQKYCDIHSEALKKHIDSSSSKVAEPGHPVHTFKQENHAIQKLIDSIKNQFGQFESKTQQYSPDNFLQSIHPSFNLLMDIEKHFIKKENLLFPYLEKYNITGPPKVMWGKDDEIRSFLKSSFQLLKEKQKTSFETIQGYIEMMFMPTLRSIEEMIYKEENILFPMCLDTLNEIDWYEIYSQSDEIGYCIYEPKIKWQPISINPREDKNEEKCKIQLTTGSFTKEELESVFNSVPFDITFVDKDDKVKYFSSGKERIFQRSKTIIGRLVQHCHPPSSVHIVEQILDDFKSGKQNEAKFWINLQGKFILIIYYALRDESGNYLGTLEVSQDATEIRNLTGERRLLTYDKKTK